MTTSNLNVQTISGLIRSVVQLCR